MFNDEFTKLVDSWLTVDRRNVDEFNMRHYHLSGYAPIEQRMALLEHRFTNAMTALLLVAAHLRETNV